MPLAYALLPYMAWHRSAFSVELMRILQDEYSSSGYKVILGLDRAPFGLT